MRAVKPERAVYDSIKLQEVIDEIEKKGREELRDLSDRALLEIVSHVIVATRKQISEEALHMRFHKSPFREWMEDYIPTGLKPKWGKLDDITIS